MKVFKIAIDGCAGAGKSTTAKRIAEIYKYVHVNSGNIYRALTCKFLEKYGDELRNVHSDLTNEQKEFLQHIKADMQNSMSFYDADQCNLRSEEVNALVSHLAQIKDVRDCVYEIQQDIIRRAKRGIVIDGRDIGSHVMPDADLKIYLVASAETRAMRRLKELGGDFDSILETIKMRDHMDINRKYSPLIKAEDAFEINNDLLTFDQQIKIICKKIDEIKEETK